MKRSVRRNVTYPDFETEINIKLDKLFKKAEKETEYDDEIEEFVEDDIEMYADMILRERSENRIDESTAKRLMDLIDEYEEEYEFKNKTIDRIAGEAETAEWVADQKEWFDSENFETGYDMALWEDLRENGERLLKDVLSRGYLELPADITAGDVINYIYEDPDTSRYIERFHNYYVGDYSIAGVTFGEEEIEIPSGLVKDIIDNDFYVDEDNGIAYYNMSDEGIHIDLNPKLLDEIIEEIREERE